jgi:hypothetical protein
MKKFPSLPARAAILISLALALSRPANAASPAKEVEKLLPPRTAVCFFDGERLADLMLNARGKLTFLYVDSRLANALSRQRASDRQYGSMSDIPPQVFAYAAKAKSKKKHVLFIASVSALKGWRFDPAMISIGGYSPSEGDIINGVSDNSALELRYGATELSKGYFGFVGFMVPEENVKPGTEITVGYGTDRETWVVPAKNQ